MSVVENDIQNHKHVIEFTDLLTCYNRPPERRFFLCGSEKLLWYYGSRLFLKRLSKLIELGW